MEVDLVEACLLFLELDPKHLWILWRMTQKVLCVLLLVAVSTKADSNVDSHSFETSNVDSLGSQNSSLNVQSQGSRAENGCWQIKYYYRLQSVSREYLIVCKVWSQKWIVLWCLLLHWLWRHTAERSWLYRRMHLHEVILFNTYSYIHHFALFHEIAIFREVESLPIMIISRIGDFLSSKLKAYHFLSEASMFCMKRSLADIQTRG